MIAVLFVCLMATACKHDDEEKVDIYASIYPVYYLTTNIVKDKMVVKQVYPNGRDVHEYDPVSDGDLKNLLKMNDSKLMLYIGAGLEAFIEDAKDKVFADAKFKLVEISKTIKLYDSITEEMEEDVSNGHILTADVHMWLDPTIMVSMARIIAEEVILIDPINEEEYRSNLNDLVNKLKDIDNKYQEALNPIPNKVMLVDHDAYLYLAKKYNITRIKTRIDNESCDISPNKMLEAISQAKENGIKYIVATKNETVCSSVNSIKNELGAEVVYLDPIATLTSSTLDKDYYDLMLENLEVLKKIFIK